MPFNLRYGANFGGLGIYATDRFMTVSSAPRLSLKCRQ